ncbi:MAG TPA: DUF721 domain-containing protein [Acidimicrobiales bacterium]|jgi:hypothetical protein|nr:DUF721 domain-containing protein [Acidimicrobiales bacterium]
MPWRPLHQPGGDDPRRVSDSLGRLAASLGAPAPGVLSAVFAHWDTIVGADVAAHAHPVSLRDGTLVVGVDQPAWATQLNYLKADLLRRVAESTGSGDVTELRVRVLPRRGPTAQSDTP